MDIRNRTRSPRGLILSVALVLLAAVAAERGVWATDWPCYKADATRSGVTGEDLGFPLVKAWIHQPTQAPRPAWPEPGRELHRLDFDYAFQPVVAGGLVYFASSADDSLRALDAATGALKWRVTMGAPIRFAPHVVGGRCYLAADDGFAYCLDAATGEVVWKFRAAADSRQMLGNERMISRWPCRSGVLVLDGVAYVSAGMWPAGGIYFYALDAQTGKQIWCNDSSADMYREQPHAAASAFTGVCPQGYMLASKELLLVPSGRATPGAYDRRTGELVYYQPYLYQVPYGPEGWDNRANGGCWSMIAGDIFFSPMRRGAAPDIDIHLGESPPRPGDGMVVYNLETGLRELNLPDKHRVLVAGDVLYAVGGDRIQAIDLKAWRRSKTLEGCIKWTARHPRSYSLVRAGTALLVGGAGAITAFDAATGEQVWRSEIEGQVRGIAVADGRVVAATSRGTIVCFAERMISVEPVPARETLTWEVGDMGRHLSLAADLVKASGTAEGYAVVIGEDDSRLAVALAAKTDLHVINVVAGEEREKSERERVLTTGLYGSRVVVQGLDSFDRLPYSEYFADLVVVSGDGEGLSGRELYRILRPCGGVLCFPGLSRAAAERLMKEAGAPEGEMRTEAGWPMLVRGRLPGTGEWRYPWADAGNTGIGEESRVGLPLEILWFGGPGPDRMMSRHWGTSTPLSVGGRVFVTGQHHVIAFDAYNGRELWARELQDAGRRYAEWLSGNFVADDDSVYVATGSSCHRLDQRTGKTVAIYAIPEALAEPPGVVLRAPAVDVEWPRVWEVLGPLPKDSGPLPEERLRTIPKEVTVDEKTYSVTPLEAVGGVLDFTYLYGGYGFAPLKPGEKPGPYPRGEARWEPQAEHRVAYAFAEINCPTGGWLTIGAGADYWMQWYLDGKPIYDTLTIGNRAMPYAITNHVFSVEVTPGEHVLAVMVMASGGGWNVISAGGAGAEQYLRVAPPEARRKWGFLIVTDDLVLGNCTDLGDREKGGALFAVNKKDGSVRWTYRAERKLANTAVASGEGQLFLLDATPAEEVRLAERRGEKMEARQTLVALDLATGTEAWRQDDVPPMQRSVQYAKGVVVVGANAAYEAASGSKLWQRTVSLGGPPLIHGDWVIAEPHAYGLRTGAPRMETDMLTGQEQPWRFSRAYGCGSVAGCQKLLFFRSGTHGFFDFAQHGTTTFGGVRPGCSMNLIAANGLLLAPEGSAGCSCSYNFQTSLALVPGPAGDDVWYAFAGKVITDLIRQARLNFGAPGDRRDDRGNAWLSYPRPRGPWAQVLADIDMPSPAWYYRPSAAGRVKGTDRPWVYGSGLRGQGKIVLHVVLPTQVVIPATTSAPTIDGKLDDACWQDAQPTPFWRGEHLLDPKTTLFMCRDSDSIYFGYRRPASVREGKPIPFTANQSGTKDANCWEDDDFEIFITGKDRQTGLQLGVSCAGGRFDRRTRIPGGPSDEFQWDGDWTYAVRRTPEEWLAEVAIPLSTIREAGLDPSSLALNCTSLNLSGVGQGSIVLTHPGPGFGQCRGFLDVVEELAERPSRRYTVRLHFAEPEDVSPGERVFDVKLQDQAVLKDFDIVKEAGGRNRALVKEFAGVVASGQLILELVPKSPEATQKSAPIVSGLEVAEERTE